MNQGQAFDSLHWFESVREKYIREKSQIERQSAEAQSKSDEKLRQTLALTLKRLDTYQKVRIIFDRDRRLKVLKVCSLLSSLK